VPEDGRVQGRALWQADEVDGVTYLERTSGLTPGAIADVTIEGADDDGDFFATVSRVATAAPLVAHHRRLLPLATTVGSFGQ
jgi:hypothetical protein